MSKNNHLVFVYGTLKRGEPNHHEWLVQEGRGKAEFVCEGQTVTKYPLVIASRHNIPFLLDSPGVGNKIKGEMYRVDDEKLESLDELECYPKLYGRRLEQINLDKEVNGSKTMSGIMYFLKKHKPEMLKLDMLEDYRSAGSHGKPYIVERDDLSDPEDIDI